MVDLNAVLKTVNSIRTNCLNLPALSTLPQGRQDTANACPLANALGAAVFPDCMLFQGIDGKFDEKLDEKIAKFLNKDFIYEGIDLPDEFAQFVEEFDQGQFPELIEEKKDGED
jgi:hypothetical protein